jgi:putative drug exporter of the RND superfamily
MLRKLVTWSYDHRRWTVSLWVLTLVAVSLLAGAFGGSNDVDYSVPGSDSKQASDLLQERFPDMAGATVDVVYAVTGGSVGDPSVQDRIDRMAGDIADVDHVVATEPGPLSEDGSTGILYVRFDRAHEDVPTGSVEDLIDRAEAAEGDGLRVELGGYAVEIYEEGEGGSESAATAGAIVVLLIAFGSVVAAGLPLVVAGLGLGVAMGGVWLVANVVDMADWAVQIAMIIGIGVGIDYALLIVTRYRAALAEGLDPRQAVVVAGTTAGRAVVYAGATAVVALLGLVLIGTFYLGVALAVSLAVLTVVLAAVTVLPALLGFTGHTINKLRLPWPRAARDDGRGPAWRWSRLMQRRPLPAALAALALLLLLSAPALDLRLGQPDAGSHPEDMTTRQAFDLVTAGFGPGFNGPLLVAVDLEGVEDQGRVADDLARGIEPAAGVAAVTPPELNTAGDAAVIHVVPTTGPQDRETRDLVRELRRTVLPDALDGTGATAHVGGTVANFVDDGDRTDSRLPIFIGGVILLSVVLLVAVFRSVTLALKAAVMNLLSIGAAYGVMALAAQGGWFGNAVGISEATPVPAWLPAMMFAVLFGLSMDYEVFLLSRIREEYNRSGDTSRAIADGLARTARVITAAAAIMVVVASSFVLEDLVMLKLAGLGLAAAIFVDATVVRMVLVPAAMELLGERNWWMPRWLDRLVPHIDMDGSRTADPATDGTDAGVTREPELVS